MQQHAIKKVGKKILLSGTALVLAVNSLAVVTPLFLSQKVSAAPEPLVAAASCTSSGVLLTLTATNNLGKDALIWFNTPYGSSSEHGFAKDSTKVWTKNTGQPTIPAGSVSASTIYLIGSRTFTASYDALTCIPNAPSITSPEVLTNSSAELSWTHSNPASITSYEYRQYTNLADANADTGYTATSIAAPATSIIVTPITPTDTTLYWRITAKNVYGFVSPTSTVGTITIDRTNPTATINTDQDLYGGSRSSITASGTSNESGSKFNFTITDASSVVKDTSPTGNTVTTWNILNVNDRNLYPSGNYYVNLSVTDAAGNVSDTVTKPVTIDNDGPATTIEPLTKTVVGKSVTPIVTADDPSGIKSYSWRAADPAYASLISDSSAKEPTFKPSKPGTYTFYLTVTDMLDNSTVDVPFEFEWATIIPTGNAQTPDAGTAQTTPSVMPPAVALPQFASTDPRVLGITTAAQETGQNEGKTKSITTQNKKEKEVIAPASSGFAWYWFLLLLAVLVAMYYAYRNWRLGKENQ